MSAPITVREACRRRMPLDGADAQCLEHALTITERERDEALAAMSADVSDVVLAMSVAKAEVDRLRAELAEMAKLRDWYAGEATDAKGRAAAVIPLEAEVKRLRWLMQEAIRDYHGKAVLFSALFLEAAGEVLPRATDVIE